MELSNLGELIFNIKEKISNDEYLGIMNQLKKIYEEYETRDADDQYEDDIGSYNEEGYPDEDFDEDFDEPYMYDWHAIYNSEYRYIWADIHDDINMLQCDCNESQMKCSITNIRCIHHKSLCEEVPGMINFLDRNKPNISHNRIQLNTTFDENTGHCKLVKFCSPILTYISISKPYEKALLILLIFNFAIKYVKLESRLAKTLYNKIVELKPQIELLLPNTTGLKKIFDEDIDIISSTLDIWMNYVQ